MEVKPLQERRPQGRRKHERRSRDAGFFLVERRKGDLRKYASIVLNFVLLAFVTWLYLEG